jgi:thiol-disulfide isomerase/thioredoxin
MEALIRCMIEDGPESKRPPHKLFALAGVVGDGGFEEEELFMTGALIAYSRPIYPIPGAVLGLALMLLATPAMAVDLAGKPGDLIETNPARPVPVLNLTDLANEQPTDLAAYKGRPLIVNLWATWCAPCVKEMPSLAKLAADLKDQGLAVVAISEDRGGKFAVDGFLKEHTISGLPIYLDKTMSSPKALKGSTVLPMSVLINSAGMEVGRVYGDRDWASPESRAEVSKLLGLKAPA